MMTLPLIGAKLLLCLPKLKNYGLLLSLCMIFAQTVALSATEFSIDHHTTEEMYSSTMMPQVIRIPITSRMDTVMIPDCGIPISFESDSTANIQYVDDTPRNSVIVICPTDSSQFLRLLFPILI